MFSRRNVGHASTCNSVGQTAGYFIGNVMFLAFESADFCNKYIRSEPQSVGILTLSGTVAFALTSRTVECRSVSLRCLFAAIPVESVFLRASSVGTKVAPLVILPEFFKNFAGTSGSIAREKSKLCGNVRNRGNLQRHCRGKHHYSDHSRGMVR